MADYYELLVKEYLEQQGYVVRLDVKFKKNKGNSDIDILAVPCKDGKTIVGEVKSISLSKNGLIQEENDFNNSHLKDKVKELIGDSAFEKYIYCWSVEDDVKKDADKSGIKIIQFPEIINELIKRVVKTRESEKWIYEKSYPNTMLLQMLYHFSKPEKGIIRVNLDDLKGK